MTKKTMKDPLRRLYNYQGEVDEQAFRERMQPVGQVPGQPVLMFRVKGSAYRVRVLPPTRK